MTQTIIIITTTLFAAITLFISLKARKIHFTKNKGNKPNNQTLKLMAMYLLIMMLFGFITIILTTISQ
mgnify:CR=1 FL=1